MIKKSIGLLMLICIFMSTIITYGEIEEKFKDYRFDQDIQIKGVLGGYTFFFYVDKYWKLKNDGVLVLSFSQSDIKEYKNSTLNVYLNDFPIKSMKLFDKEVKDEQVKIKLPVEKIINDYNAVTLKIYHRITDEPCTDEINPGNWIVFHQDSYVHIGYEEKIDSLSIKEYPYPYFINGEDKSVKTIITLPSMMTDTQITAAIDVASDFGRREPFKDLDIAFIPFNELLDEDKKNNHFICISNISNLPKELSQYISDKEKKELRNEAIIKEIPSPYNKNKRMLLILSYMDEKLIDAVSMLRDRELVSQMKESTQYSTRISERIKEPITNQREIKMKDLGYTDQIVEGIFYQQVIYATNIPKGRMMKEDASVNILMRYAKTLNFDKSSVTVYLNDVPIGDKELSYEKSDNDILSIKIPKEFRDKSYLEVKIVFYLEPKDFDCYKKRESNAWTVVSNESYFDLPYEFTNRRLLEDYPHPFIKNGRFNDLVLVLPKNPNGIELSTAANIAAFMGHNVNGFENLKVVQENKFIEEEKKKNIILLGIPKRNKWIEEINNKLHVPFDDKTSELIGNKKIPLVEDVRKNAATIQIIKSPWNDKKTIMIVSGVEEKSIKWTEAFLKDYGYISRLKGDAAVIDDSKNIYTAYYDAEENVIKEKKADEKLDIEKTKNTKFYPFLIFIIILGLMLLTGISMVVRRNK